MDFENVLFDRVYYGHVVVGSSIADYRLAFYLFMNYVAKQNTTR